MYISSCWSLLSFLCLSIYSFHQIWGGKWLLFFQIYFFHLPPSRTPVKCTTLGNYLTAHFRKLFFSLWIVSISICLLIFSSAISSALLLIHYSLYSDIIVFICRSFIWVFLIYPMFPLNFLTIWK